MLLFFMISDILMLETVCMQTESSVLSESEYFTTQI